ncbi:MAG: alpha/beta fold hydrolase [Acidothermales bacterium]|nr:alpha/beta fold hydrolase [Acidothermales bacterium]
MTDEIGFAPSENPYVVEHGGFYRRWLSRVDDLSVLSDTVASLTGTTDDVWVPAWRDVGRRYEDDGDRLRAACDHESAGRAYAQATVFYAIGRFPAAITPLKAEIDRDCARAYLKSCERLDPPLHVVDVECEGRAIVSHYRAPANASPGSRVPAVLVMCGSDVFKEDRGWVAQLALDHGLAALVMDSPGTGQNPFPHAPESVRAWIAAVDWLAARPEIDEDRIGSYGISRGGYSVMLLAGSYPERVRAAVAIAGNHFGYRMSQEEARRFADMRNRRSEYVFGRPGDPPTFTPSTVEQEEKDFRTWALSELGIVDDIVCPVLMINGKRDHLAPIGNIYYMLEHGPVTGKEARVYPDDGHCAFKHVEEWGPASFRWLMAKLAASVSPSRSVPASAR